MDHGVCGMPTVNGLTVYLQFAWRRQFTDLYIINYFTVYHKNVVKGKFEQYKFSELRIYFVK